jgi:hypothetical protein
MLRVRYSDTGQGEVISVYTLVSLVTPDKMPISLIVRFADSGTNSSDYTVVSNAASRFFDKLAKDITLAGYTQFLITDRVGNTDDKMYVYTVSGNLTADTGTSVQLEATATGKHFHF